MTKKLINKLMLAVTTMVDKDVKVLARARD